MDEKKRSYRKQKLGKDLTSLVGLKFNRLTIIEILPRERDEKGLLKLPECVCVCDCGRSKRLRIYDVINNNVTSCGCMRGRRGIDRNVTNARVAVENLSALYYCPYTTSACVRSNVYHLCCHECDRVDNCSQACNNSPEKCHAKIRKE